jgi:tetratricopeptide (TPR) repeat protein
MDATSSAAAQCHYQLGCYKDALVVLEQQPLCDTGVQAHRLGVSEESSSRQLGGWIIADDPPAKPVPLKLRTELAALPNLARQADVAMCRFRSAVHSSPLADKIFSPDRNDGDATLLLQSWKDAIETNSRYRKALSAAAISLLKTCFVHMEFVQQTTNQSVSTSGGKERTREHISIQNALKSTAISILMAGIASAHLNLHEVELQPNKIAWDVLVQCAIMAADLMLARREFMQCISCEEAKISQNTSSLDSSLRLLNDTLTDERSAVALHSFRTALKVAALACGKLILPLVDVQCENGVEEPVKKKQKKLNEHCAEKESDAWNAQYVHGNTALHCEEQLVDALSFHSALIHCTQKAKQAKLNRRSNLQTTINELFSKREACFNNAILGEAKMKALLAYEAESIKIGDVTGYACKMYNCLRALEISNDSFQQILPCQNMDRNAVISVLERLATESTSRFACECMGCILAQNGEYSRAIEMFQLALERCEKCGTESSINSDVEVSHGIAERRILSSMAACFVAQGGAGIALEMLLTVWSRLNEATEVNRADIHPKSILFSAGPKETESVSFSSNSLATASEKAKLLWMIFYVSSLAGDWSTCLGSTELLAQCGTSGDGYTSTSVDTASAFVLLQCERGRESREAIQELIPKLNSLDMNHQQTMLTSIIADIFSTDISLVCEHQAHDTENACLLSGIRRAAESLNSPTFNMNSGIRSLLDLRVLVLNNIGINCLIEGDSARSLCCFREASELIASPNDRRFWLLLPVHFNLALLLLRDGRIDESAKAWLSVRGHLSTWESAKRNDHESLAKLRDSHLLAMNRHGMIIARRSVTGATPDQKVNSSWVAPILSQEEWQDECTHVNGVDGEQVCTLDFVLLKHALSTAEKKCNTFLRQSAHFGY